MSVKILSIFITVSIVREKKIKEQKRRERRNEKKEHYRSLYAELLRLFSQ